MPNQKFIAALPLAALFAALCHMHPAAAQDQGMVVSRDLETGQLRAPTPAEVKALHAHPAAARMKAGARPAVVTDPDGKRHVTIGRQGMVYSVVRRDADGNLEQQCVQGQDAAAQAVAQRAPANNGEDGHDIR